MFKNMKIKYRLALCLGTIIFGATLIIFMNVAALSDTNTRFESFVDHSYQASIDVRDARIETLRVAKYLRDMTLEVDATKKTAYIALISASEGKIEKSYQSFEKSYQGDATLMKAYRTALEDWLKIGDQVIAANKANNTEAARTLLLKDCPEKLDKVLAIALQINDSVAMETDKAIAANVRSTNQATIVSIVLLALSMLISLTLAGSLAKGILKPIDEIEQAAEQLSQGNLKTEIHYHAKNELGFMAHSLRNAISTLSSYVEDISTHLTYMAGGDMTKTSEVQYVGNFEPIQTAMTNIQMALNGALGQIGQATAQVADSAAQVAGAAQDLSAGTITQSASVEELSSTTDMLNQQIQANAQGAQRASELSNHLSQEVATGNQQMNKMTAAMNDISTSSLEIGKIIKTIEDIAFQTNILALNASVEAARAGSAGKGFAVVADEVRNLASKSADAAKNTAELIERSITSVQNGTMIAKDTAQSLQAIVDSTTQITTIVQEIAVASAEQAAAAKQVDDGIMEISTVVEVNAASAEESAAASEELSGQAQMLEDALERFKLDR